MNKLEKPADQQTFASNPKILEHYTLLQEIGVLGHIDSLDREIKDYKSLVAGALDIFNRTSIEEIIDAAVWQISDHFMPAFIVFLWKPLQNREDIIVKSFKNYKLVDLDLQVENIDAFEPFFKQYPKPIDYGLFSYEIGESEILGVFNSIDPNLIIPIQGPSGLYGLVLLGHKTMEDAYTSVELEFIRNLMSFVSQAVQNHLHYEQTLRDVKTGLYNNGFFRSRLNEEILRTKRNQSKASIIMIDVDRFKHFNDTYGHLAGDRVLESLAITIKQAVRGDDVPSRFGGEEFSVLLPDTDKEEAFYAAERIRNTVAEMKVPWEPVLPQVTISLGVYTFDKDTMLPAAVIIDRADEALYLSKELGRNRTTVWGAGLFDKIERMKVKPLDDAALLPGG